MLGFEPGLFCFHDPLGEVLLFGCPAVMLTKPMPASTCRFSFSGILVVPFLVTDPCENLLGSRAGEVQDVTEMLPCASHQASWETWLRWHLMGSHRKFQLEGLLEPHSPTLLIAQMEKASRPREGAGRSVHSRHDPQGTGTFKEGHCQGLGWFV
jgi:hypothetical protein